MEGHHRMKLVTLADKLDEGVAIGTLATAIEKYGIWGWDRYGRSRHFSHDSEKGKEALDLLAAQSNFMGDSEQELSPLDEGQLQPISPYDTFGWKESEVPDFEAIEREDPGPPPPRPQSASKSANAYLVVIGVLLEFIKGGRGSAKKHPSFESEAALIREIVKNNQEVAGLGERALQDKFAYAKRTLDMKREECMKDAPHI